MPAQNYRGIYAGPAGSLFIGESKPESSGLTLKKFTLEDREAKEFVDGVSQVSVSNDGKKMLAKTGPSWKIMDTTKPSGKEGKTLDVKLKMQLNRSEEWTQMFDEAWRYERDYFYDPNMQGVNWKNVGDQYMNLLDDARTRWR